jgi:hypothetical protein
MQCFHRTVRRHDDSAFPTRITAKLALLLALSCCASAQTRVAGVALPEDPGLAMQQTAASQQDASGLIEGTVTDARGDLVPDASVTLAEKGHTNLREATTDAAGHFLFKDVAGGTYSVLVSAHNLKTYLSPPLVELPGEHNELPPIALTVVAATSIDVSGNSEQVAEQELNLETKQRVLGVLPNFFTSFVYDATPLNTRQKFKLTTRSLIDPTAFLAVAISAGAEQYEDTFPSWGNSDAASYGKRYAAGYGDELLTRTFSYAIYPSIFHQDPRYFYLGPSSSGRKRFLHAVESGIITRGDNGKSQFNISDLLGSASAGALSSLYHPASDGPGRLAGLNVGVGIGGKAVQALIREFIWPRFTTHVPDYATGKTEPAAAPKP